MPRTGLLLLVASVSTAARSTGSAGCDFSQLRSQLDDLRSAAAAAEEREPSANQAAPTSAVGDTLLQLGASAEGDAASRFAARAAAGVRARQAAARRERGELAVALARRVGRSLEQLARASGAGAVRVQQVRAVAAAAERFAAVDGGAGGDVASDGGAAASALLQTGAGSSVSLGAARADLSAGVGAAVARARAEERAEIIPVLAGGFMAQLAGVLSGASALCEEKGAAGAETAPAAVAAPTAVEAEPRRAAAEGPGDPAQTPKPTEPAVKVAAQVADPAPGKALEVVVEAAPASPLTTAPAKPVSGLAAFEKAHFEKLQAAQKAHPVKKARDDTLSLLGTPAEYAVFQPGQQQSVGSSALATVALPQLSNVAGLDAAIDQFNATMVEQRAQDKASLAAHERKSAALRAEQAEAQKTMQSARAAAETHREAAEMARRPAGALPVEVDVVASPADGDAPPAGLLLTGNVTHTAGETNNVHVDDQFLEDVTYAPAAYSVWSPGAAASPVDSSTSASAAPEVDAVGAVSQAELTRQSRETEEAIAASAPKSATSLSFDDMKSMLLDDDDSSSSGRKSPSHPALFVQLGSIAAHSLAFALAATADLAVAAAVLHEYGKAIHAPALLHLGSALLREATATALNGVAPSPAHQSATAATALRDMYDSLVARRGAAKSPHVVASCERFVSEQARPLREALAGAERAARDGARAELLRARSVAEFLRIVEAHHHHSLASSSPAVAGEEQVYVLEVAARVAAVDRRCGDVLAKHELDARDALLSQGVFAALVALGPAGAAVA